METKSVPRLPAPALQPAGVAGKLRRAVVEGDCARARELLAGLPVPATPEEAGELRSLLLWALDVTRIRRAHQAGRLAALTRSGVYRFRGPAGGSTFSLDA